MNKNEKKMAVQDEFLTEEVLVMAAELVDKDIQKDILAHEAMDIEIPVELDGKLLAMARKLEEEHKMKTRRNRKHRFCRIAALFLVAIVSIGSLTMMTSEAFRQRVIEMFANQDEGAITLQSGDEEELIGDWEKFWYPSVVPEGFNLIAAEESDHFLLYSNLETEAEFYLYEQDIESTISIDTDTTEGKVIKIGYSDGYIFQLDPAGNYGALWRTENKTMMMYFEGNWTEEQILDIAENMEYIEKL